MKLLKLFHVKHYILIHIINNEKQRISQVKSVFVEDNLLICYNTFDNIC